MLDTTFLIDHLRAVPGAIDRLEQMYAQGDDPIVTSITTAELWAGLRAEADSPLIDTALRYLEYVPGGPEAARVAGEWRASARRKGFDLDVTDALIAATAFHLGAAILTRNVRDLALTPVRVETY
jgi:predicted nucleic acid-binding protein